jgi:hypothetical protein
MAVIYSDINILSKRVFEEKIMMSDLTVPFSEV